MTDAAASPPAPGSALPAGGFGVSRLLSDDRLARRAKAGDRQAFEAIYQRYHQDLYRFCLAMVGNAADAQEALQDTMVKVLRGLPGETRHIHLKPWLYRIARNESIETIRRRRDNVEIDAEQMISPAHVADTAESRDRLRHLIADLAELPERQRAALVMRELAGLGFAEIAEAFETSAAVARQTVYEARLSLHQMEEGREMSCPAVMRELSDGDGRITRRRDVRAHLRSCPDCRAFEQSIATRHHDLAAIAPLPVALSAGLLHGLLTGQANAAVGSGAGGLGGAAAGAGGAGTAGVGTGAAGVAGSVGAGAGKVIATSAIVKSVAAVAVIAAVGVTAADRGGLVHVGLPGSPPARTSSPIPSAGEPAGKPGSAAASPRNGIAPSSSPSVNPAAAARLAEALESPNRRHQAAARSAANGLAGQGTRQSRRARGQGAAEARSHGHEAAAGHAHHANAKSVGHSRQHSHSHPHPHPQVRHPAAPPASHSQPATSGTTEGTPSPPATQPSHGPTRTAPVQPPAPEVEATLPEP